MTIGLHTSSTSELPFQLESQLEKAIAADPAWLSGMTWGEPRPGHPEGQVQFHIRDVLDNIDRYFGDSDDRARLRLIALIHDTFKYQAIYMPQDTPRRSHGYEARQFAERYIHDQDVLEVIELHDEAYKAYLLLSQNGDREAAERRARELIRRLDQRIDLFMHFYLCDNQAGDKSADHYEWFQVLCAA
jgi:hypothetical protein